MWSLVNNSFSVIFIENCSLQIAKGLLLQDFNKITKINSGRFGEMNINSFQERKDRKTERQKKKERKGIG